MQKNIHIFLTKNTIEDEDYPLEAMRLELSTEAEKGIFLEEISNRVADYLKRLEKAPRPTHSDLMSVLTITAALNEFTAYLLAEDAGAPEARLKAMLDSLRVMWRTAG